MISKRVEIPLELNLYNNKKSGYCDTQAAIHAVLCSNKFPVRTQ